MSSHTSPRFKCTHCRKESAYRNRSTTFFSEMIVMRLSAPDEKRTYVCEHCGTENVIALKSAEWLIVDSF